MTAPFIAARGRSLELVDRVLSGWRTHPLAGMAAAADHNLSARELLDLLATNDDQVHSFLARLLDGAS